jgi:hypothetical protein
MKPAVPRISTWLCPLAGLLPFNLEKPRGENFNPTQPNQWRGWNWLLGR